MIKNNLFKKYRSVIGVVLFYLALKIARGEIEADTQKARENLIKNRKNRKKSINGSKSIRAARLALDEAVGEIKKIRAERESGVFRGYSAKDDFIQKLYVEEERRADSAEAAEIPVKERLEIHKKKTFYRVMHDTLRVSVAGKESFDFKTTDNPADVNLSTSTYKDWDDKYRGDFSNYAKTAININASIPKKWLSRVYKKDLAEVDDKLILDAQQLDCSEKGIEIFSAVWAKQSWGCSVVIENGFIARNVDKEDYLKVSCHGTTYASVLKKLRSELKNSRAPSLVERRAEKRTENFYKRFKGSVFSVSIDDAFETGACVYDLKRSYN